MGELRAKSAEVLAELRYDLPDTYAFHRRVPFPFHSHVVDVLACWVWNPPGMPMQVCFC